MAIQDISNPSEKYIIRGWDEDNGDPKVEIEIRPGLYGGSLLPLIDVVEAVRAQVLATPTIETVTVRNYTPAGEVETLVPAP
jgi:hypothetical protein